jgi:plastocyanin
MRTPPEPALADRRRRGLRLATLAVAVALTATACISDDPVAGPADALAAGDGDAAVTLRALNLSFDRDRIDATAGQPLTITFDNADDNIPHNLHVEAGTLDVKTDITPGPTTQVLEVTIDTPGTYEFSCDVHPEMTGDLVVA